MTQEGLKELLVDKGFEDTIVFEDPTYCTAVLGITEDGRLIYDYERMASFLVAKDNISFDEAYEFIDYNTIRAIPYMGEKAPIIKYDLI